MLRVRVLFVLISTGFLCAAPTPQNLRLPLVFEPNQGQSPKPVKWLARGAGYDVFLTTEGATITLRKHAALPLPTDAAARMKALLDPSAQPTYSTIQMKLLGSRPWNHLQGADPTGGVSNYSSDSNRKLSLTGIPQYDRVIVPNVYKGIDLAFHSSGSDLEYDFILAPGADPNRIRVAFEGAQKLAIDPGSGDLIVTVPGGPELRQIRPHIYQQIGNDRREIAGGYRLVNGNRAEFRLSEYDRSRPLVIDPTVNFTTFFGGNDAEQPAAITFDSDGNTYVTGGTFSRNFPVTTNTTFENCKVFDFGGFCGTGPNVFTIKLNAAGTIVFSSYGGVGTGNGIAVDSTGIYTTGIIFPPDIDNIIGFSDNNNGDIFVARLAPNPSDSYFQILGLDGTDFGVGIALDAQHNAWIAGAQFPDGDFGPKGDVLILRLDSRGILRYSQTFGSNGLDVAYAIAMVGDRPWITGQTCGDGFPTTDGILSHVNGCGVFVLELETTGIQRMGMVFGGNGGKDAGVAITPNGGEDAYIAGYANSPTFPTTIDAFQTTRTSLGPDAFVAQIDATTFQGKIVHCTLLGADGDTLAYGVSNPDTGGIYVVGSTSSVHFPGAPPLTPNPTAGFVTKLKFNLTEVFYTKLLGAVVSGVAVRGSRTAPNEIFTTGYRYTNGLKLENADGFVVKLTEDVPASTVEPLPAHMSSPTFMVTWAAAELALNSATFDVFVQDNGAPFAPFQTHTTLTSAPFTGMSGHTYGFFSIATDAQGHSEPPKTVADAVVTIGATPPTIQCTGCYFLISSTRATTAFNVGSPGSGSTFGFSFRSATQAVQLASTTITQIQVNGASATFTGEAKVNGQTGYNFTVTASDGGAAGSGLDSIAIQVTGPNNFSFSVTGAIAGGNIIVHE